MTNWRGKAHNPKAVEPDAHERFSFGGDPKQVIDAYRKVRTEDKAKQPDKYTYEMVKEARTRRDGSSMSIGHYAYEMMYDIYTGIEDELVENSIDTHLRIYPDYVPRSVNIIEHAINCSKAKMRAIVSVDHFFPTIGQAWAAQEWVDEMVRNGELEQACLVLGVHMLAWSHHPDQINLIRKYPAIGGGVMFWTQSQGGQNCGPELHIVDAKGRLDSEVKECIRLCAEYKIPIHTGSHPYDVTLAMVQYASEVGAHIVVCHAAAFSAMEANAGGTPKQAREMGKLGAYLALDGNKVLPSIIWPVVDPNMCLDWAMEVGPEYIIVNSDHGQPFCGDALECWQMLVRAMLHKGISKEDIKTMIQNNPAKFLYLDE